MTDPTARDLIQRLADAREAEQAFGPMPDAKDSLLEEARAYLLQPVDLSYLSNDEHSALCPQGYHATGDAAPTVAETPTNCIYLNTTSTEEVMRLDNRGLHYKGQFIADAGEAHQLLVAWLRRNSDGPAVPDGREPASVAYKPSGAELHDLWLELYRFHDGPTGGEVATIAHAALERWGSRTPAPIPPSERLPTEADCDAEGRCWWWHPESHERNACWCCSRGSGVEPLWLPCWALPVPAVEAENG